MHWALAGEVPQRAGAVCRPTDHRAGRRGAVGVLRATGVPVTAAGGRSGVCGASVPVFGGVVLDLTAMQGIVDVDAVVRRRRGAGPARSGPTSRPSCAGNAP